jgi:homoserine dehydrogenase
MYITEKTITRQDLAQIEKYADKLFAKVGIDVEFTRHFLDRVNDERNKKQITVAELTRIFKQVFKKFGKPIAKLGPDAEAVMKDMQTDINMPFVLKLSGQELELVAKTIMRKKDFKTSNKTFAVEEVRQVLKNDVTKQGNKTFKEFTDVKELDEKQSIRENIMGWRNAHRTWMPRSVHGTTR